MPKVTKEYVDEKKREIVNAAIRLCNSKPAYAVTIRDVVKECKISQGGMYHYFSSIDEIFIEILNRAYSEVMTTSEHSNVFISGKLPSEIIIDFLLQQGRLVDNIYKQFGRLIHDLQAICLNDSERGKKIVAGIKANDDGYNAFAELSNYIDERIVDGSFKCVVPKEHILFVIISASDGIKKALIDPDSAGELAFIGISENECATAENMMEILAKVIVKLLNVEYKGEKS
jgi:AcrR family transcriptional regulator